MKLRTDHVAGAAFIGFGLLVYALSGELPFGRLSMPGAGFLPKLIAGLLIVLGAVLALRANQESAPLIDIAWNDLPHAASVIVITAAAIALYTWAGFIITMIALMFALLVLVERQNIFRAGLYSLLVALLAFGLFDKILRAPLPIGPLGF